MIPRVVVTLLFLLFACDRIPAAQTTPSTGATLDQLLAPIALYPDQLLAQMLISATVPESVLGLANWLKAYEHLKGTELQDAAVRAGFDASYVALTLFPQVVTRMAEQIAVTRRVGQAFASDRTAVFDAIQRLRKQAKDVGTLKSSSQQNVETRTTSSGQEVIVIEPTNPQVVYVPQYNSQVVYTQAPTTTVVVQQDDDDVEEAVAAGLIGFTAGIAMGAAIDNNYYYGPYGWYGGGYMYNDSWDDYWDNREDAREDWTDHREDLAEERGDLARDRQEQRSERVDSTQEQRTERRESAQQQRSDRAQSTDRAQTQSGGQSRTSRVGSPEARGYGSGTRATQRSGGSDAFSGYSSGRSTGAASQRGQRSRGSARGGGGRRR